MASPISRRSQIFFKRQRKRYCVSKSWRSWLCLSLGFLLLLLRGGTLRLDVLIVDGQRLVNLGLQGRLLLNANEKMVRARID